MDAAPAARLYLDQVIAPHRSLPVRGFQILIGLIILINVLVGALFVLNGAWPAPVFLGIDVLAVFVAFRISYRQARARERVEVSAHQVRVTYEAGGRARTVWSSPTAFTRVRLEDTGRYGAEVRLVLSGKRCVIGRALGPKERAGLAEAVDEAIRAARGERHA